MDSKTIDAPKGIESREGAADDLSVRYARVRERTLLLAAPLSDEDCCVQSMPEASPVKWHLAHTTWFFETFVLERHERGFTPFDPAFRVLFNSYYNGVGDQHARSQRGLLTRPSLEDMWKYRRNVDARMDLLLGEGSDDAALRDIIVLGLNHEQQHQELLLADVKHLFSMNPQKPAYHRADMGERAQVAAIEWIAVPGGNVQIGHDGGGFCFDNELPRHTAYLRPCRLASRLVSNGEFRTFIEDGGYDDPRWWLSEGWDWIRAHGISHPIYWIAALDDWKEFTLSGAGALIPGLPVTHVSYFEADAYARWAGARLPTEAEWEHAANAAAPLDRFAADVGRFADDGHFHPRAATGHGLTQMFGDAWEWTSSSYSPYPGYRQAPGAIGEYNGKFMVNQYVLRGGSCATPSDHIRATYRNFFPATARWQFSGIRLAEDAALR
ncbi:MAG: ergothioneine biosynthesis protein EgtB [Burkholderiales bacterium]